MVNFTFDDLANFSREEKKLINELMGTREQAPLLSPSLMTVKKVLNYAQSTSVRNTDSIGKQEFFLN